ncbi:MAG: hypothetical protein E4H28_03670 [Gemmatimonadales bacterium]|nr:MAG: hypothetical protein E4H28_03670 [Gemmatimonadales bacterium]
MRILLLSNVLPGDSTGGALLLHRHFSRMSDVELVGARFRKEGRVDLCAKVITLRLPPWFERLSRSRWSQWVETWMDCCGPHASMDEVLREAKATPFDLVMTTAQGRESWCAMLVARRCRLPLVSVFHDWWPELRGKNRMAVKALSRHNLRLARQSSVAFCVSEAMQEKIGRIPQSMLLYPIPSASICTGAETALADDIFRVVHIGGLYPMYRDLLTGLCGETASRSDLSFRFAGPDTFADRALLQLPNYAGYLKGDALDRFIADASALMVMAPFDPAHRSFLEAYFPSKLTEYCRWGKPIVIWGPEYAAPVRWAMGNNGGLVVADPSPRAVVEALAGLNANRDEQSRLLKTSAQIGLEMFDPDSLQAVFEDGLRLAARDGAC